MDDQNFSLSWRERIQKFRMPLALSLVGLVLIAGGVWLNSPAPPEQFPKESMVDGAKINVDVSGAVAVPGVYQLQPSSRVEDAVKAAGGLKQDANQEYTSKYINMAQKLTDGSKVYVPYQGESGSQTGSVVAGSSVPAPVNINTASNSELEELSGIGPVTAAKIISGRPYQTIEEILSKKIVSKGVFEKIKDQLVLY